MIIKKLELYNFQKHSHLEIDFTQGVNVIYGQTDAGKSCIRRALDVLYFNNWKPDYRKSGTKKTIIKGTFDNGIQVERINSASVNAYVLHIPGKEKPDRFDAINRSIPEEVLKVLKTTTIDVDNDKLNLNIANQIALPFLLDKSGTFRSKLFNKLTGSDIVDKSLQGLNKDILRISREEKLEKEGLEGKKKQMEELTKEKVKIENIYNKASKIFTDLKEKQEKYEQLKEYLEKLDNVRNEIRQVNDSLKEIKLIDNQTLINLNDNINKLSDYSQLLNDLKNNKRELENTDKELGQLKIPEIDINILKGKTERINNLIKLKNELENIQILREKVVLDIIKEKAKIENGQIEYRELLKKSGKCPVCKGKITEECLERIKL